MYRPGKESIAATNTLRYCWSLKVTKPHIAGGKNNIYPIDLSQLITALAKKDEKIAKAKIIPPITAATINVVVEDDNIHASSKNTTNPK